MSDIKKEISLEKPIRKYKYFIPKTKNELVKEILKRWWYGVEYDPLSNIDIEE